MQAATDKIYGATILAVDYESVESLTSALQGVHSLISVVKVTDPAAMISYHSNMLKACQVAKVSRFTPSDWSLGPSSHSKIDLLAHKDAVWELCEKMGVNKGIECASFQCGGFMNYFAQGLTFAPTDSGERKKEFALGGLVDDLMLEYINIPKGKLVVPLDNERKPSTYTMTHLDDIGKFVAAAVDFPVGEWQGHLGIAGDTFSVEDVANHLKAKTVQVQQETITPYQCDEKIEHFDRELAKAFNLDALLGKMVAQMMKILCEGQVDEAVITPTLNRLCPHVKPVKIGEFIDQVY